MLSYEAGRRRAIGDPSRLTSGEISGSGIGEQIAYYYTADAGPGTVQLTVDGKNKPGGLANAVGVEVSTLDAVRLVKLHLGNTTISKRVVERLDLSEDPPIEIVIVHA